MTIKHVKTTTRCLQQRITIRCSCCASCRRSVFPAVLLATLLLRELHGQARSQVCINTGALEPQGVPHRGRCLPAGCPNFSTGAFAFQILAALLREHSSHQKALARFAHSCIVHVKLVLEVSLSPGTLRQWRRARAVVSG
eukprot:66057-Amphidinium_carterae.1